MSTSYGIFTVGACMCAAKHSVVSRKSWADPGLLWPGLAAGVFGSCVVRELTDRSIGQADWRVWLLCSLITTAHACHTTHSTSYIHIDIHTTNLAKQAHMLAYRICIPKTQSHIHSCTIGVALSCKRSRASGRQMTWLSCSFISRKESSISSKRSTFAVRITIECIRHQKSKLAITNEIRVYSE